MCCYINASVMFCLQHLHLCLFDLCYFNSGEVVGIVMMIIMVTGDDNHLCPYYVPDTVFSASHALFPMCLEEHGVHILP